LVCPKAIDATVRHEQAPLITLKDLNRTLIDAGLPATREVFKLDYHGTPEPVEAEIVEAEANAKK
jgi:hypothetical protein